MSRSRKKIAIVKDHRRQSWWFKRQASKAFRKRPLELSDTKPYHWYCQWDIHDWIYYSNDKKDKRK